VSPALSVTDCGRGQRRPRPRSLTTGNSTIQIAAAPAYRGRVTALWSTAFVGSTPIGATMIGAIGAASPRLALLVGGPACGAAAITGIAILARARTGLTARPGCA
jgi:hypothetical protein